MSRTITQAAGVPNPDRLWRSTRSPWCRPSSRDMGDGVSRLKGSINVRNYFLDASSRKGGSPGTSGWEPSMADRRDQLVDEMKKRMEAVTRRPRDSGSPTLLGQTQRVNRLITPASRNEQWKIDPTVRVVKGHGGTLRATMLSPKARKLGHRPLAQAYTAPLRMIVINPRSQQELGVGQSPTAKPVCFRARPWCSPRITAASRVG